jgi:hypothetical protein
LDAWGLLFSFTTIGLGFDSLVGTISWCASLLWCVHTWPVLLHEFLGAPIFLQFFFRMTIFIFNHNKGEESKLYF